MENYTPAEEQQRADRSRRMLTRLLVFAIVMFFAALTSAYLVSMSSSPYWMSFRLPQAFLVSTGIIVASSLTIQLAVHSARKGRIGLVAPLLAATLLLGGAFTWFQVKGWDELAERKLNFVSKYVLAKGVHGVDFTISKQGVPLVLEGTEYYHPDDAARRFPLNAELSEFKNGSSAYFHVLTRAHYAHIFFGLLSLLVMIAMALRGRYTPERHVGLWAGSVYWHFLGGLWIYLLLFLYFVH